MSLHPDFPVSPYSVLVPGQRWIPGDEAFRATAAHKLIPPLVSKVREGVHEWRHRGYEGASPTTRALLHWWFDTEHRIEQADRTLLPFRYYFAQREAVESAIWLYEVQRARDPHALLKYDGWGSVSQSMFAEVWPRYVLKMATGAGKTKVISLLLAWSYFHKLYETESPLARNFLVIAPNIIVLDRLRADFDGLRIFFNDPILPDNGYEGQNWRDNFQITLHIQDDVRVLRDTGNIFLTNVHRVFMGDVKEPSLEDDDLRDYFLQPFGEKPVGKTTDSRTDLGEIIRDVSELVVFNDEAHHIHDPRMAWFKSIQDIHHQMLQQDRRLALQIDVTATPRKENGDIFVQTVSDYPLVEAIHQNVVKHPVLPDAASRDKLHEHSSALFEERYADYLKLGVEEWRKSYAEHERLGKKAVLFVMVDDTKNCDEVGKHLEKICPELQGAVLVIHTKNNGDISEAGSGKAKEELEKLRASANSIDSPASPYKAIVSVLMLKEGWDVRNVTTVVGLRAYAAKSNILPEQTLGRGLRRMYFGSNQGEKLSVMGTPPFMEFVESLQSEGVTFEHRPMGDRSSRPDSLVVEVDSPESGKDLDALDIALPKLSRKFNREFKDLDGLDPASFGNTKIPLRAFSDEETREIVFKTMLDGKVDHIIRLDGAGTADSGSVIAFFTRQLLREMHLVGGYEILYGKVKEFIRDYLFEPSPVDLDNAVTIRNLSEPTAGKLISDSFRSAINALTIKESGSTRVEGYIRLRDTRPFRTDYRSSIPASKCVFNRTVGEANADGFELTFAGFLQAAKDVQAFGKNYFAVGFKIDYVKANGDLSTYTPDFLARTTDGTIWVIETKGRAELDVPQKLARLRQWCAEANSAGAGVAPDGRHQRFRFLYVDQEGFERHTPRDFAGLAASFTDYQN